MNKKILFLMLSTSSCSYLDAENSEEPPGAFK